MAISFSSNKVQATVVDYRTGACGARLPNNQQCFNYAESTPMDNPIRTQGPSESMYDVRVVNQLIDIPSQILVPTISPF
jgi:hypothetical protein